MRCVTADLWEADNAWHFRQLETKEHAHWLKALRVWRGLDDKNESLCVLLDELLLSWEQNHETQTLMLYIRGGTRLDCVARFVTGALDPTLCWVGPFVVAPHMRNQGLGSFYWNLTRVFIGKSHRAVERLAITPLDSSKRFWSKHCGFTPLPAERNSLGGIIKTLVDVPAASAFADAPLHGIEVWELNIRK
jgi:hypothetical protein